MDVRRSRDRVAPMPQKLMYDCTGSKGDFITKSTKIHATHLVAAPLVATLMAATLSVKTLSGCSPGPAPETAADQPSVAPVGDTAEPIAVDLKKLRASRHGIRRQREPVAAGAEGFPGHLRQWQRQHTDIHQKNSRRLRHLRGPGRGNDPSPDCPGERRHERRNPSG